MGSKCLHAESRDLDMNAHSSTIVNIRFWFGRIVDNQEKEEKLANKGGMTYPIARGDWLIPLPRHLNYLVSLIPMKECHALSINILYLLA